MRKGVVALLVAVLVVAGCQAAAGDVFQYTFNQPLALTDERPVGQTFAPATGRVAGVDVLVATFGEPVDAGGRLQAVLRDGAGGRVLARATVAGDEVGDNEWATLRFPEPAPAPQVAAVELTWDGSTPLAAWANTPAEEPGEGDLLHDPYPGGQLLVDGEPAVGDLAFRAVGTGGAGTAVRHLAGVARAGAGRLAGDPLFAVAWLGLLAGAAALGVWGLRRPAGELGERPRRDPDARP